MAPYPTHLDHSLEAHKGPISALAYNHTGQYCVTGGRDRQVQLWNPVNAFHVFTYQGHSRDVLGVAVAPDNSKIASCGVDRSTLLFDVSSGDIIQRFTGHVERVNCVAFNEESTVIISGSFDASLKVWDVRSLQTRPIQTMDDAGDSVMSVQVVGVEVIAGSTDGKVRIYDLRMGQLYEDYIGASVTSARLSNDGNCVLVSTTDSTARLMDKSNGTLLNEFKGHKHTEFKLDSVISNMDAHVVSGSEDGNVYIWDVLDGKNVAKLESHKGVVTCVDYHPSDTAMVTAGNDGVLRVWS